MKKVVLITGASSGVGKTISEFLTKNDFIVYGTSRSPSYKNNQYKTLCMDVNNVDSVHRAVDYIINKEGRIDVLINNAGISIAGAIEDTSLNEAKEQFDTNFFGAFTTIKAVLPYMRGNKYGIIINISSLASIVSVPFQGFYSASKFALDGLSEALRLELKMFNIKVANINPGDLNTSFANNRTLVGSSEGNNTAYSNLFFNALKVFEKEERNGKDPIIVAKKVLRIINSKQSKRRVVVGSLEQRLVPILKSYLPHQAYEKIMQSHFQIK